MNARPLDGKTVAVACSEGKSDDLRSRLETLGARVVVFPAIRVRPLEHTAAAQEAIGRLQDYDWLIFTSSHAATFFARLIENLGGRSPAGLRVCAIGPATAESARRAGFRVDLVPERFVAEGVVEALSQAQNLAGLRFLLPRARVAREIIPSALREAGAAVDVLPVYETVPGDPTPQALAGIQSQADLLVFTSSSNVSNFVSIVGEEAGRTALAKTTVAVIGPVTARTAESFGKLPEIVPPENTIPSLVSAIAAYFSDDRHDPTDAAS